MGGILVTWNISQPLIWGSTQVWESINDMAGLSVSTVCSFVFFFEENRKGVRPVLLKMIILFVKQGDWYLNTL